MLNLPIIDCTNCGACCMEQGSPPGYLWLLGKTAEENADWPDQDDLPRLAALPSEALEVLIDYRRRLLAGEIDGDVPCCWLDQSTMRCRWYDHRPEICRELKPGSEGCRRWRDRYNIDVERLFVIDPSTLLLHGA